MPCITTSSFMTFKLNLIFRSAVFVEDCLKSGNAKRLFKMINDLIKNESVLNLKVHKREEAFGAGG